MMPRYWPSWRRPVDEDGTYFPPRMTAIEYGRMLARMRPETTDLTRAGHLGAVVDHPTVAPVVANSAAPPPVRVRLVKLACCAMGWVTLGMALLMLAVYLRRGSL